MLWKSKKKFLGFLFVFSFLLFLASFIKASQLEINYPEIFGQTLGSDTTLPEYLKYVFNFAIMISGVIALAVLIWGGVLYLISTGNPAKMKEAREEIFGGTIGLVILLSSYIILHIINPGLLTFNLPPLNAIIPGEAETSTPLTIESPSLIMEELPLGQAAKEGLWGETKINNFKQVITDFQNFLEKEEQVDDSELTDNTFNRISGLNKYLGTLTDECHCGNLTPLCTKPATGLPVACVGDVCQKDQGNSVEEDSPRAKINKILEINGEKIKTFLDYQKKIKEQKDILREGLRKFQIVEGRVIACQNENKDMKTLNDYLSTQKDFEQTGNQITKISSYWPSRGDPLTFYCSSGGTVYDYPYFPEKIDVRSEELTPQEIPEQLSGIEKINCPVELPIGEILDNLRELAIINIVNLNRVFLLIEEETKEIQEMTELVSQCNKKNCNISCNCVPNLCFMCCVPIPCTICVPSCLTRCTQVIGSCNGDACPTDDIEKKSKEIKKTEDKIFDAIKEIKQTLSMVSFYLNDKENPYNLNNLSVSAGLCHSSDIDNPDWALLSCEDVKGNYGSDNQIINSCHPRNFYCCSLAEETGEILPPTEKPPSYIVPAEEFQPLPSEDNCPKGWLCSYDVKYYNQYEDASEPLKQLLSCMRANLDKTQQQEGLEDDEIIGKIASISDKKLYQGTCDWEAGHEEQEGCSYPYEINYRQEQVSAHYGGTYCRYDHKSYALEFDVSSDFQKNYLKKIIEAAKECSPGAYVLDTLPYAHIDIGGVYSCGSNEF